MIVHIESTSLLVGEIHVEMAEKICSPNNDEDFQLTRFHPLVSTVEPAFRIFRELGKAL